MSDPLNGCIVTRKAFTRSCPNSEFRVMKITKRTQRVRITPYGVPALAGRGMNSHERARCSDTLCTAITLPPEGGTPNHEGKLPNEPIAPARGSTFRVQGSRLSKITKRSHCSVREGKGGDERFLPNEAIAGVVK